MINTKMYKEYYQALLKNRCYEGIFYKTTGIFCSPTCPARKPKFENCEFFESAQHALVAPFPCQRCRPSYENQVSELIQAFIEAVENNPEKHSKDEDFPYLCIDASTARLEFKKRFDTTFVAYHDAWGLR